MTDIDLWSGTRQVSYSYDAFGRRVSRIAALDAPHGLPGAANVSQPEGIPSAPSASTLTPQASTYHASDRHQGRGFGFGENSHHVAAPGSGQGMQYLYDGFSMDVVAELYGAQSAERAYGYRGSQSRAGAMYLRGNGELIARLPTARYGSEQALYYTEDILGSTMQTFGPGRSVKDTYRYTAYGVTYEGSLAGTNPYGYNGKRYDRMSGLYNYGYRDYIPEEGRWTTTDPVRAGANWYAYVNADPVDFVDPLGLIQMLVADFYSNQKKMVVTTRDDMDSNPHHVKTVTFTATSNVAKRTQPFDAQRKLILTMPPDGKKKDQHPYIPTPFPKGRYYRITSVVKEDNKTFGPYYIGTDAVRQVIEMEKDAYGVYRPVLNANGNPVTVPDTGLGNHAGGYTGSDPATINNVNDNTFGCIRMSTADDRTLAKMVMHTWAMGGQGYEKEH